MITRSRASRSTGDESTSRVRSPSNRSRSRTRRNGLERNRRADAAATEVRPQSQIGPLEHSSELLATMRREIDNEVVSGSVERQVSDTHTELAQWIDGAMPFIILLSMVAAIANFREILILLIFFFSLRSANSNIRKQLELARPRSRARLVIRAGFSLLLALVGVNLAGVDPWAVLKGGAGRELPLVKLLWVLLLSDLVVRHAGAAVKSLALAAAPQSPELRRPLINLMCVLEASARLIRETLPLPLWCGYLGEWPEAWGVLGRRMVQGMYWVLKALILRERTMLLWDALVILGRPEVDFGHHVSLEQLRAAACGGGGGGEDGAFESTCVICYNTFANPIRLHCGHLFCEGCVHQWLQRERTCPLCRSPVRCSRLQLCGDCDSALLPVLF